MTGPRHKSDAWIPRAKLVLQELLNQQQLTPELLASMEESSLRGDGSDFVTQMINQGMDPSKIAEAFGAVEQMPVFGRAYEDLGISPEDEIDIKSNDYVLSSTGVLYMLNPLDFRLNQRVMREHRDKIRHVGVISLSVLLSAEGTKNAYSTIREEEAENFIRDLVAKAQASGASDIHLAPRESEVHVRFRIDGMIRFHDAIKFEDYDDIAGKIMGLCGLNAGEYLSPFDGRFEQKIGKRTIQLRMAGIEVSKNGKQYPKFTIRLLNNSLDLLDLEGLGFSRLQTNPQMQQIVEALRQPHGMIIVTGPTGSGKSTTLFSAMRWLFKRDPTASYYTLEDPVEADLPFAEQVQINKSRTYPLALRNMLRQDPDVLLVGEMRDAETMHIGIEAALTGHRLFSTLHANTAPLAAARLRMTLLEAGVDPSIIGEALLLITAQRVIPRLCSACSLEVRWGDITDPQKIEKYFERDADPASFDRYRLAKARYSHLQHAPKSDDEIIRIPRRDKGCPKCMGNGTKGRVMVSEVLTVTDDLRELLSTGATEKKISSIASKHGYQPMWEHAWQLIKEGHLSLDGAESPTGLGPLPLEATAEASLVEPTP